MMRDRALTRDTRSFLQNGQAQPGAAPAAQSLSDDARNRGHTTDLIDSESLVEAPKYAINLLHTSVSKSCVGDDSNVFKPST